MKGGDVAVVNVPGGFMQAVDELVHVRFPGKKLELILETNVSYERGQRGMFVELLRALYG